VTASRAPSGEATKLSVMVAVMLSVRRRVAEFRRRGGTTAAMVGLNDTQHRLHR
jgi:hypothetical protein